MATVYYKNGNSYTTITAADIGAAASSHTHSEYYTSTVSRTANTVLAAPNGSNGSATFRKLVSADIPQELQLNTVGKNGFIASPAEGRYQTNVASVTGMLKVTLPVSWTNTMLSFDVTIYNYISHDTVTYHVAGYNYGQTTSWISCTAYCDNHNATSHSNLTVRFGHDGSKCCVCIGEINTVWSYPQVLVHNFFAGFGNYTFDAWKSGWVVGFTTTSPTTTVTISETGPAKLSYALAYRGSVGAATNWDDVEQGVHTVASSSAFTGTGNPGSVYTYGLLHKYYPKSAQGSTEIYYSHNGDMFFRQAWSGSYAAWHKVYTDKNKPTLTELGAAASSHTHSYAGSGSVGGAANSSQVLNSNSTMVYGWNGLNYFNASLAAGNAAKVNDAPSASWWHILRFNHGNADGYYTDLAVPFNSNSLYYKCIRSGAVANNGWVPVLDKLNFTSYVTPAAIGAATSGHSHTTYLTSTTANGYQGMGRTDGNTADWIRTTTNGIIPYSSDATNGASALGTSSWPFKSVYAKTFYGTLSGSCTGSSASCTGNAATATSAGKWTTARTLTLAGWEDASVNIDGSANATLTDYGYSTCKYVTQGNMNTPYWRIMSTATASDYADFSMVFTIDSGFDGGFGIVKVNARTNQLSANAASSVTVRWLVRQGFAANQLIAKFYSTTKNFYCDLYFKAVNTYDAVTVRCLSSGGRGSRSRAWTLTANSEAARANPDIRTYNNTVEGADGGAAQYSNRLGSTTVGSASQPIYLNTGAATGCTLVGSTSIMHSMFDGNLTTAGYIPVFTDSWADGGYMSKQQLRNAMGLGNTTGAVPVANGGTGGTTKATARSGIGITSGTAAPAASGTAGDIYIQYA